MIRGGAWLAVVVAACTFDPSGPSIGGSGDGGTPIDPLGHDAHAPATDGGGGPVFDARPIPDAAPVGPDARTCPGIYEPGPTGCYRVATVAHRWVEIEANCEADDGHLVVIDNEAEQAYVTSLLTGGTAWIGASDRVVRGFVWVTRATATFTAWQRGEPNNGGPFALFGEDCVETHPEGWNDKECNANRIGVCEHDGTPADPSSY